MRMSQVTIPAPELPQQLSVDTVEPSGRLHVTDRMVNIVQSSDRGGQRPGASFVQSWINRHLSFTHPNSHSAERKVMVQDIDTAHPQARAAYGAVFAAAQGVLALGGRPDQNGGAYTAAIRWLTADGARHSAYRSFDEPTPEFAQLLQSIVALDAKVESLPKLPASV